MFWVRESPFVFEDAVPKEKFFDRQEEIEFFVSNLRVKRKMLLCIVAPLKYGKSSLMMRYFEILRGREDIIPIYVDLNEVKSPLRFIVERLYDFGIDLRNYYKEALRGGELFKLFDALNSILERDDRWLFVLFDEFHLLPELIRNEGIFKNMPDDIIYTFFRGFAEGRRISYIVCGSAVEPLMRALDVWGGRFQIIYLGPFSEEDATHMIKKLFAEGGMEISDEYAKIIAESAGYHPFYIQYMGHQIYVMGEINRRTIRSAKRRLYEFLSPIFLSYLEKIRRMGGEYIEAIAKLINNEPLSVENRIALANLVRMGILRPRNARFDFVDPLFRRYMEQVINNLEPAEVIVVGHWAERIVGNYLLRRGFLPYYSHDSRGAFDIYVRIKGIDVGIQVRYTSGGIAYLSDEDSRNILLEAKKMNWVPILAIVGKKLRFFSEIRAKKYIIDEGYTDIVQAIEAFGR